MRQVLVGTAVIEMVAHMFSKTMGLGAKEIHSKIFETFRVIL
jgi:hypothetical protein